MKIYEGQGPIIQQTNKNRSKNGANEGDFKKIMDQTRRMGDITKKLMGITKYETKDYVQGVKIVDIEKSSQKED